MALCCACFGQAGKKISELPAVVTPTTNDLIPIVHAGATSSITVGNLGIAIGGGGGGGSYIFSTGLTNTAGTITVNTSQNITTLSNLTSNGFITTTGGNGTLHVNTGTPLLAVNNLNDVLSLSTALTNLGGLAAANNLSDLANPATALGFLGGTTTGKNVFTLTNPSAVTWLRVNADNTVTARTAAQTLSDIGGISGNQTITLTGNVTGIGTTSIATTIAAGAVTNAMLAGSITAAKLVQSDLSIAWTQLTSTPTTLAGYGIANGVANTVTVNGHALSGNVTVNPTDLSLVIGTNVEAWSANLDTWSGKTPYAGTLTITTGKTHAVTNSITLSGTDGATINVGPGGTLGTAAYTATSAYEVPLTFSTGLTRTTNTITSNAVNIASSGSGGVTGVLPTASGGTGQNSTATFPTSGTLAVLTVPINSRSAAYTTTISDQGDAIYHPSADTTARTWTIDSNANVACPIGTIISFENDVSAGTITLAITTDTLVLSPAGTTGSITILAGHVATAHKVTSTRWLCTMD